MRISSCQSENERAHPIASSTACLRSLFCFCFCFCSCCPPNLIPSFLCTNTKDAPNSDSCANPLPLSHSDSQLRQGKLGALRLSAQQVMNPKSCLKKKRPHPHPYQQVNPKGNVRWMDMLGKDLAHIKEYEPSESESLDEDDHDGNAPSPCICCIQ